MKLEGQTLRIPNKSTLGPEAMQNAPKRRGLIFKFTQHTLWILGRAVNRVSDFHTVRPCGSLYQR